jgi:DNA polymerase I-like protein with 3'-5' exonuclease and polymerase domains
MVGADFSGIELRMFAHYLARYDGGKYGEVLLNGDIHQVNANKIGISRKLVKTVTYAFLYGAGDEKIGRSYDPQLSADKARKKGKEIRQAYLDAIEGLEDLVNAVKKKATASGYVNSIDGRRISVDGPHKALNYLLQSSAGVVAKRWMVMINDMIKEQKLDSHQLAFIHDALFYEIPPAEADTMKFILEYCAKAAGEFYKLRCSIEAVGKSGPDFYSVH